VVPDGTKVGPVAGRLFTTLMDIPLTYL
jgi:hypothetical protein